MGIVINEKGNNYKGKEKGIISKFEFRESFVSPVKILHIEWALL